MIAGVVCCYSIYYWVINPSLFAAAHSASTFLVAMYLRSGAVMFHVMNIVTYLVVLGVCLVLRQSRYAREQEELRAELELAGQRLETRLSEARLAMLTNQIHPHFLFNAMNSIASLIAAGDRTEAYEAITLLAGLLRKTFQYMRQPTIKLGDEVELAVTTMKIGKLRFEERLSWTVNLPAGLVDVAVPPFLVQPLAENALRHAVEAVSRPVHILIDVRAAGETLFITVSDDGPGAGEPGNGEGVGLKNLRERLALMGERRAGMDIATPGGGFKVTIRLPSGVGHA
jgi:LytS/YehU family sensor histidine kinase